MACVPVPRSLMQLCGVGSSKAGRCCEEPERWRRTNELAVLPAKLYLRAGGCGVGSRCWRCSFHAHIYADGCGRYLPQFLSSCCFCVLPPFALSLLLYLTLFCLASGLVAYVRALLRWAAMRERAQRIDRNCRDA